MNEIYQIRCHEPIWGSWHVDSLIGAGGFGKVYRIFKEEWGYRYESALKVITIPTKEQFEEAHYLFQGSVPSMEVYFEDCIKEIVSEIRFLYKLRGNSHIISYEDHLVKRRSEELKWDVLMRMEYATPIHSYLRANNMSIAEIIRLGIEICTALELFFKRGIIHRDIKEENIFLSKDGNFKIGDFGVARILVQHGENASIKGTPQYAAPEVFRGEKYDHRADQYSLGILLYRMLNKGRIPFLSPYPEPIRYKDSEIALDRRFSGEPLPLPQDAGPELGDIILKACQFNEKARFASPTEMKEALEECLAKMSQSSKCQIIAAGSGDISACGNSSTILLRQAAYTGEHIELKTETPQQVESTAASRTEVLHHFQISGVNEIPHNNAGNIVCGGFSVDGGAMCYASNVGKGGGLYAFAADDTNIRLLNRDYAWFINIIGEWLYYVNESDFDKVYRVKCDGTGRACIGKDPASNLLAVDDQLIYLNTADKNRIYCISRDGSHSRCLCEDSASDLNVVGQEIYYINKSDGAKIYRLDVKHGKGIRICNYSTDYLNISHDHIYFCSKDEAGRIYRLNHDGNQPVPMGDWQAESLNFYGDRLYFRNLRDDSRIYRMDRDGKQVMRLSQVRTDSFCVTRSLIFFMNRDAGSALYRMTHEGEYIMPIIEDEWIEI